MVISKEVAILITNIGKSKRYGPRKLFLEFPAKNLEMRELDSLKKRERPERLSARSAAVGLDRREGKKMPVLYKSWFSVRKMTRLSRQISRETGVHRSTVIRIVHEYFA